MKVAALFRLLLVAASFSSSFARDTSYSGRHDWGFYGLYPREWYKSFNLGVPLINFLQWSEECSDGYTFCSRHEDGLSGIQLQRSWMVGEIWYRLTMDMER